MSIQLPAEVKAKVPAAKIPVEYEEACKALVACTTIDEAKYWDNKAEALAAWAKIYHNDQATAEARRLKLHAHRRMGELAEAERPTVVGSKPKKGGGFESRPKGASSLLIEHGLTENAASAAAFLRKLPPEQFHSLLDQPRPPAPITAMHKARGTEWTTLRGHLQCARAILRNGAGHLARALTGTEGAAARVLLADVVDLLDKFEQHLPKEK